MGCPLYHIKFASKDQSPTPAARAYRHCPGLRAPHLLNRLNVVAPDPPSGNYIGIDGDVVNRAPIFQTIGGLTAGDSYQLQFYQAGRRSLISNCAQRVINQPRRQRMTRSGEIGE
ncbi:MAG: hypothetical protein WB647_11060 [Roseiarcus sp.]|uniref:hypothetical protein n=1 Tax=Roseiarcus sp. TaxID=1969460 RepID=UPI003C40E6CC